MSEIASKFSFELRPVEALILESDPKVVEDLRACISSQCAYVEIAENASQALDFIKNKRFDLIFCDGSLPEMKGFDWFQNVFDQKNIFPEIILLAEENKNYELCDIHQSGMCHIVNKPLNRDRIRSLVDYLQAKRERRFDERVQISPEDLNEIYGDIYVKGESKVQATVNNVGRGGFFYAAKDSSKIPNVGQIVDFDIRMAMAPDSEIKGKGIVRWTNQQGAGIEFLSISDEAFDIILAYVSLFKVPAYVPIS